MSKEYIDTSTSSVDAMEVDMEDELAVPLIDQNPVSGVFI